MEEMVQGLTSIIGRYKRERGMLRIVRNGEAKELICMTHGHELTGDAGGNGDIGQKGIKGRKNGTNIIA